MQCGRGYPLVSHHDAADHIRRLISFQWSIQEEEQGLIDFTSSEETSFVALTDASAPVPAPRELALITPSPTGATPFPTGATPYPTSPTYPPTDATPFPTTTAPQPPSFNPSFSPTGIVCPVTKKKKDCPEGCVFEKKKKQCRHPSAIVCPGEVRKKEHCPAGCLFDSDEKKCLAPPSPA